MKRIVFHGTHKKETADKILKSGFEKGTYFARHLQDAICFGGKYVFYVALKVVGDNWQIVCRKKIPPSKIKQLVNFNPKEIYYNPKIRFSKGKLIPCHNCGADIGSVRLSILGKPVIARCPKCNKRFN